MTQPIPPCEHPESMRTYRDITDRDRLGRLLTSTRTVTCHRNGCGAVLMDSTKTWTSKEINNL